MQLVEHWQDVAEDLRAGRIYLPGKDLAAYGVTEADLAEVPHVLADPNQLEQVFLNICLNACQAMGSGGGRLTGRAIPTIGYRGMHSFDLSFERFFVLQGIAEVRVEGGFAL